MKTIWKFQLELTDRQRIEIPVGAEVLTAQVQGLHVCLWAIVVVDDNHTETEMRTFDIYGTGNPFPDIDLLKNTRKYIGTVQNAGYVWHVFEIV